MGSSSKCGACLLPGKSRCDLVKSKSCGRLRLDKIIREGLHVLAKALLIFWNRSTSGCALNVICSGASSDLARSESVDECRRLANVLPSSFSARTIAMAPRSHAAGFWRAPKTEFKKPDDFASEDGSTAKSELTKVEKLASAGASNWSAGLCCEVKASTGDAVRLAEAQAAALSSDASANVVRIVSAGVSVGWQRWIEKVR